MLSKVAAKGNTHINKNGVYVVKLPTFKGGRPLNATCVPQEYEKKKSKKESKPESLARNTRRTLATVETWISLLSPKGQEAFIFSYLRDHPDLAAEVVLEFQKHTRWGTRTTLSMMTYVGLCPNMLKKLSRFVFHVDKVRRWAPLDKVAAMRTAIGEGNFTTLAHRVKTMKRPVKGKGGSTTIFRDQKVLVSSIRPAEHVVLFYNQLNNSGRWVDWEKRFDVPFTVDSGFDSASLWKFACDQGNKSTKMTINPVNVDKPQGREHLGLVFEFDGIKDSGHNVDTAMEDEIKFDFESILNRRAITLDVTVQVTAEGGTMTQAVLAMNTNIESHDIYHPKSLKTFSSQTTTIQATTLNDDNKISIVCIDFERVVCFKPLCTPDKSDTIIGLSFFDSKGDCIASALFRDPIECKHMSVNTVPLSFKQSYQQTWTFCPSS